MRLLGLVALLSVPVLAAQPPVAPPGTPPMPTPAPTPAEVPKQPPVTPPQPSWPKELGGKDLNGWLKQLREDPDGAQRETAVKMIPLFGPPARVPAMQPLATQLSRETDPGVRMNIIITLGAIGAENPKEASIIVNALNGILSNAGPGSPVRLHATRALASYGNAAAIAVPTVVRLHEDPSWETRHAVANTLGRIARSPDPKKGPSREALDVLTRRWLNDEKSAAVRLEIAQSLLLLGVPVYNKAVTGDFDRTIKPYFDAVTKKLETETDGPTRIWLLMTLMTYDARQFNESTIAKIADYINQPDLTARVAAVRALAMLGVSAKPALPSILSALKWEEPAMLVEAMFAVIALETLAKDALPDLERIQKTTKDEYVKTVATEAIEYVTGKKKRPVAAEPPPPKK